MDLQKIKTLLNKNSELVFKQLGLEYEILGDNIYSKCPIHDGSDNPRALSFSIDRGIWKCWTRDCQHHFRNDIFGLIQGSLSSGETKDANFKDALGWACKVLKVKHVYSSQPTVSQPEDENDNFYKLISLFNEKSVIKHHESMEIECSLKCPSQYFVNRGFKPSTMEYFGVGDCNSPTSKMYDRAVIPIHDDEGTNIVAMICRSVKEYKIPKFLFYSKDGFDKRYFFYNYHRAIGRVKDTGCLFIVEGQGDVWRLYEAGITNVMSIFGKTISKEQEEKLLKMPMTHIIILTDNDQAGRESKIQIQRQLGRMYKLTFPKISNKDVGDMSIEQVQNKILPQIKGTY
jgi:5S rRNA maturation endonuclease (ribonuclease M5)